MSLQLPPKRYQDYHDSKFDPIRHLPWFRLLEARREKLDRLSTALSILRSGIGPQEAVASEMGVDARELRDYKDFVEGRSRLAEVEPIGTRRGYQMVLDQACDVYRDTAGKYSFNECIRSQSQLFGVNSRHVIEIWEVDPLAYPSHYRGIK